MTPEPLMTKREVADYLHVSTRTVDRIPRSSLPVIVVGGRRRYRQDDVFYYVASRSFGHRPVTSSPVGTI